MIEADYLTRGYGVMSAIDDLLFRLKPI